MRYLQQNMRTILLIILVLLLLGALPTWPYSRRAGVITRVADYCF